VRLYQNKRKTLASSFSAFHATALLFGFSPRPTSPYLPPLLRSEVLRRLREQSLLVQQLIAAFGLHFRVAYTPADHPSVTIVVALGYIDFQVLILGNF
jgi:hypothetical protein